MDSKSGLSILSISFNSYSSSPTLLILKLIRLILLLISGRKWGFSNLDVINILKSTLKLISVSPNLIRYYNPFLVVYLSKIGSKAESIYSSTFSNKNIYPNYIADDNIF